MLPPDMFIIDDIISWIVNKVLNKIFPPKDNNEEVIKILSGRIDSLHKEKDLALNELQSEKQQLLRGLRRKGISVNKLIERYDKPLRGILFSYASQFVNENGRTKSTPFISNELKRYNAKYLGGNTTLIPPSKVPKFIKNRRDLEKWFETDILKGRYCKVIYLALIDIKNNTFWKTYLPYKQKRPRFHSIGEVLDPEDILSEKELKAISISEMIRDGNIGWLAATILTPKELETIMNCQTIIENKLGNPSLRLLSQDNMVKPLAEALAPYIGSADSVAKTIVDEARFWDSKLK